VSMSGVSTPRELPKESCLPLSDPITDDNTIEPIICGRRDAPGTSQLFQAVAQELQEPDHVLVPYEHRNTA
jgi:hypothetical protein